MYCGINKTSRQNRSTHAKCVHPKDIRFFVQLRSTSAKRDPAADGLELVHSKKQFKQYLSMLKTWRDEALLKSDVSESDYQAYREKIETDNNTPCSNKNWRKEEEIACVCDDLRDYAFSKKTLDSIDEDITLITSKGVPVGVITLRVPYDNDDIDYEITGFVKKPDYSGSLKWAVDKYLNSLKPRVSKGKTVIGVDSAKRAVGAYERYGFEPTGQDANHYGKEHCGCQKMIRSERSEK
ncbi:hypothetical protein [Marinomonas mediterranea]|uniref:hypothetical protein n=1 Tax=Marinomonas mediterranea TaxID=119864 RepID=UPI002349A4C8|nr:hypothetical protein [Marinomonas mediterranea]WCN09896.1 hypothetical protein GV055_13705 [Marinomonas mediterranea]